MLRLLIRFPSGKLGLGIRPSHLVSRHMSTRPPCIDLLVTIHGGSELPPIWGELRGRVWGAGIVGKYKSHCDCTLILVFAILDNTLRTASYLN